MGHRVTVILEECPENKTHQDLQAASRWFPLSVFLLKWGAEQIGHPTWSEWQAFTGGLICICLQWHYWTIPKLISSHYTDGSLTAVPWGPGGPGIPAWPGPPCRKENRRRINSHVLLRLNFLIIMAGIPYLYSRNTRCAIFSINTRQALKKQANKSVDFIWHPFWSPTMSVHSHSLPFCQLLPVGPGYLGCPADDKYCQCLQCISRSLSPFKFWEMFHLLCLCHCFVNKLQGNDTWRVTYFDSFVSCLSRRSLGPLLTLQTTQRGLEYLRCTVGTCF